MSDSQRMSVPVSRIVEDIVGCKWSLAILGAIRDGHLRPGAMQRAIHGISAKVLNERLTKLVGYGVLERIPYPEVPPRVEYRFTRFGTRLHGILDQIRALQADLDEARSPDSS